MKYIIQFLGLWEHFGYIYKDLFSRKPGKINWFIVFCNQGKSSTQCTTQTCPIKEERRDQNLQKNHPYENVSSKAGTVKSFYEKFSKSIQ